MTKSLIAMTVLAIGISANSESTVKATPELTSAIQKYTDATVTKIEKGHAGTTSVYEVKFDTASAPGLKEIEMNQKDFALVSAEGGALKGTFNPGSDLKTLSDLAAEVAKNPNFIVSEWELEKKMGDKWVYEVSGKEAGKKRKYQYNARDLAMLDK